MPQVVGEISFDAVTLGEDDDNIEGCYRIGESEWKVFFISHSLAGDAPWTGEPIINSDAIWPSGVKGVNAIYPIRVKLNKFSVRTILSEALGENIQWTEVRGPDSLQMK